MIIGAGKSSAIEGDALLKRYFAQFRSCLRAGGTKLMAIGYSFSDSHVDAEIETAMAAGLRMYVVNPSGLDVLDRLPRTAVGYAPGPLTAAVIGFSTRSLSETFGYDDLQRQSLERFLAD